MMCLGCGSSTARLAVIVMVIIMVPAFVVVIECISLLEVVVLETAAAVMASILLELPIIMMGRTGDGRRGWRRIALVGGWRVWTRPLGRRVWLGRVASAHWSVGISRRAIVKTHANGRTHRLGLGWAVVSSSTSSSGELLLMLMLMLMGLVRLLVRRSRGAPLLRSTTWLLWGWVGLTIGRLLLGSTIRRLLLRAIRSLLLVKVLGVVRMIILGR